MEHQRPSTRAAISNRSNIVMGLLRRNSALKTTETSLSVRVRRKVSNYNMFKLLAYTNFIARYERVKIYPIE